MCKQIKVSRRHEIKILAGLKGNSEVCGSNSKEKVEQLIFQKIMKDFCIVLIWPHQRLRLGNC